MSATLQDIADIVGVSKPAISAVLNDRRSGVRVSPATRKRILKVARELNYQGNAAARALATRRTGNIGFILSDRVTDGLANDYFSQNIAGVEQTCRDRGYGLHVSLYNLSNLEDFVFPKRVGQRSVDGLILAGYVSREVLERFQTFGLPCVCIGENVETAGVAPSIRWDMEAGLCETVEHLAALGHRRIGFGFPATPWFTQMLANLGRVFSERAADVSLVQLLSGDDRCDYSGGPVLLDAWYAMEAAERPTALVSSAQACLSLLRAMDRAGLSCPEDLSLVSSSDTRLSEYSRPALTAIWRDLPKLGSVAADALIDALEGERDLDEAGLRQPLPCRLVKRESCGRAAG